MSTQSSVYHQEETARQIGLHLFKELIEDGQLYLEVTCGPFTACFRVPDALIEKLNDDAKERA